MHQAQCLTHNILNYSRKYKINRITHNFFKTQLESPNFYGVFLVFFQPPACSDLSPHLSGRNHLLLCLTPVQCDSILLITLFQTPPYIRIHILFHNFLIFLPPYSFDEKYNSFLILRECGDLMSLNCKVRIS